ncbi:MAG: GNAT family N-acetyltransferase [Defluviitaleaceae bacterium]|nr:GNAT family N-acetyltransferase [Defluviitaleaceae bacterium]
MNITLREIDQNNFDEVISLKVEKYCASNLYSLAEAKIFSEAIPLAIYNDDKLVGFIMYGKEPRDNNEYWIDRLMVDEKYQKNGFGKRTLEIVIDKIKQDKTQDKIKISTNPENMVARKLYAKLGFYETGELHGDEVLMILEY